MQANAVMLAMTWGWTVHFDFVTRPNRFYSKEIFKATD